MYSLGNGYISFLLGSYLCFLNNHSILFIQQTRLQEEEACGRLNVFSF